MLNNNNNNMSTFVKIPDQWVQKGMDLSTCYILSKILEFQKRGKSYHMANKKFVKLYPCFVDKTLARKIEDLKVTYIVVEQRRHGNNVAKLRVDEAELECFLNGKVTWKTYVKEAIESQKTIDNMSDTMDNMSETMDNMSETMDNTSEPIEKKIKENKNINKRTEDIHPPSGNSSSSSFLSDEELVMGVDVSDF